MKLWWQLVHGPAEPKVEKVKSPWPAERPIVTLNRALERLGSVPVKDGEDITIGLAAMVNAVADRLEALELKGGLV